MSQCTVEAEQDVERELEEMFAAPCSPIAEVEDRDVQETSCSHAAVAARAPGSVAVSEGAPSTPVQSVMPRVEPRIQPREVCLDVKYETLITQGPGTSEEKVAARAAELERISKEAQRLYIQQEKCDTELKAQGSDGDTEKDSPCLALCKAVRDGRFDVRSALAQRFAREHRAKKELGEAYKQCAGTAAKRAFRQHWALQQYKKESQLRLYNEEYQRVDTSKGQYLPFAVIVEREGFAVDPVGAVQAAIHMATRCSELGGNWVQHNPFTNRVEFLRLERQHHEIFTKSWSMMTKSRTDGPAKTIANPPPYDERHNYGSSLVVDKPGGHDSGMCEGKSACDTDADKDDDGDNKDTGKGGDCKEKNASKVGNRKDTAKKPKRCHVDCLLEKAHKLRGHILTAQSQATQLVAAINADEPAWRFARNPQNVGELEALASQLELKLSDFGRKFLLADVSDMKKEYMPQVLCAHLAEFLTSAVAAKALQSVSARLYRMRRTCKALGSPGRL